MRLSKAQIGRLLSVKLGLRCCGDCCRNFPLSASLEDLRESVERDRAGLEPIPGKNYTTDAEIVLDMVIPLGTKPNSQGEPTMYYSCRHLRENGDCGIYLNRPAVCRDYPSYAMHRPEGERHKGKRCEHKNCNWIMLKVWAALAWVGTRWNSVCHRFSKPPEKMPEKVAG